MNDTGDRIKNRTALQLRQQNPVPGGLESALLLLESSCRGVLVVSVFNFISLMLGADSITPGFDLQTH